MLAKVISKQFIKMAKDSDRVQNSVDRMREKVTKESIKVVKAAAIDPSQLPFDVIKLLSGDINSPQSLLTPENICSVPPLTNSQKNNANIAIQKSQIQLTAIIENTNKLKSALIAIQTPLTSIRVTAESTTALANSLSNIIKIIKAIPIPTAFGAPAVGLPVKVLTILSSTLISLDKKVDIAKGTVSMVPPMIKQISGILNQTIESVNKIEAAIQGSLILTAFVKSVVELGDLCDVNSDLYIVDGDVLDGNLVGLDRVDGLSIGFTASSFSSGNVPSNTTITNINTTNSTITLSTSNTLNSGTGIIFTSNEGNGVSQNDINNVTNNVNGTLQKALNESGDSSLLVENELSEAELIASFPFEYKGFLLELVNNPNNATFYEDTNPESPTFGETLRGEDFPFPSRKIRATRDFRGQTETKNTIFVRTKFNTPLEEVVLYNDPGGKGRFSYSSSVAVLVEEMKFKLDNYLLGVKELALPAITESGAGKVGVDGSNNPNPQVFTSFQQMNPGATGDLNIGGSDDPPSPTGSVDPPQPPAYQFTNPNAFTEATPTRLTVSGSFVVTRPVKIKMTTFGGTWPLDGESRGFLRIYKQGVPGYNFMLEDQYAEMQETVTTQNNPQGYYASTIGPKPEYWPINPGFANGTVASNLGIFQYVLELTDYTGQPDGSTGNFTKFEIEAQ